VRKKRSRSKKKGNAESETNNSIGLPVLRPNVAGIDIGSQEHWVAGPPKADGAPNVRVYGTVTSDLNKLAQWLKSQGVESVAMESTGVYWIPLYELLESRGFEVLLCNSKQTSNVPGRKTDFEDCQWIQLLHSCGLLRGSFRPSDEICQLRALLRECSNLIEERTRCVQRMQKALDQMNVQVHRAVTDITGTTGMSIIRAITAGERDPIVLAGFRDKRCKKKIEQFAEHLRGTWRQEHLFNLKMNLELYDKLNEMIDTYHQKINELMLALEPDDRKDRQPPQHPNKAKRKAIIKRGEESMRQGFWRFAGVDLTRIDGISTGVASVVFAEAGLDLDAFPTEKHFTSWLRLAPNRSISGGKVLKKKRNATGATRLANALRMAASSLKNSPTALGAQFRRIARRKGFTVAVFAMARRLATLIYRMLRYGEDYVDKGAQAYEEQFKQRRLRSLATTAKQMGYELKPVGAAA